jgi:hypothetical protein
MLIIVLIYSPEAFTILGRFVRGKPCRGARLSEGWLSGGC